jgi:hypothetical protein
VYDSIALCEIIPQIYLCYKIGSSINAIHFSIKKERK